MSERNKYWGGAEPESGRGVLFHSFRRIVRSKDEGNVYISLPTHQEDEFLPGEGYRVYGKRANLTRASRTIVSGV